MAISYRLNAFGFLALEAFSKYGSSTSTSGNYGFYDQILALKWVNQYVEYFGGDKNNVALTGQSSGGTSVEALLISPLAKGLFHTAVTMSGSPKLSKHLEQAQTDNLLFVEKANCTNPQNDLLKVYNCMMNLTMVKVLNSIPMNRYPGWGMNDEEDLPTPGQVSGGIAVVDGILVQDELYRSLQNPKLLNNVPTIIGTTAQEIDFYPSFDIESLKLHSND